jgi:hypothetical protein
MARHGATAIPFPHDRSALQAAAEFDMPREQLWSYLVQPEFRMAIAGSDKVEITGRKDSVSFNASSPNLSPLDWKAWLDARLLEYQDSAVPAGA